MYKVCQHVYIVHTSIEYPDRKKGQESLALASMARDDPPASSTVSSTAAVLQPASSTATVLQAAWRPCIYYISR